MGSIERAPGSGRPRTTRTAENVDAVGDLVYRARRSNPRHIAPLASLACVRLTGWPVYWNWRRAVLSADADLLVRTVVQQLTRFQLT